VRQQQYRKKLDDDNSNNNNEMSASGGPQASGATATVTEEVKEAPRVVLRLRPRRRITFSADTIDNEGMGKKSSKRCCIFHKQRDFGESSTESDSSDDSDCGDEDCRRRRNRPPKKGAAAKKKDADAAKPPAPNSNDPGAGWSKRKVVPDYQRYHA